MTDEAKRSLKTYKGHLTRATNNCETLMKQTPVDTVELKDAITSLQKRWEGYDEAYNKVESLLLESASSEKEIDSLQIDY